MKKTIKKLIAVLLAGVFVVNYAPISYGGFSSVAVVNAEELGGVEHTYGEPTYLWNDKCTECTAVYSCTDDGCDATSSQLIVGTEYELDASSITAGEKTLSFVAGTNDYFTVEPNGTKVVVTNKTVYGTYIKLAIGSESDCRFTVSDGHYATVIFDFLPTFVDSEIGIYAADGTLVGIVDGFSYDKNEQNNFIRNLSAGEYYIKNTSSVRYTAIRTISVIEYDMMLPEPALTDWSMKDAPVITDINSDLYLKIKGYSNIEDPTKEKVYINIYNSDGELIKRNGSKNKYVDMWFEVPKTDEYTCTMELVRIGEDKSLLSEQKAYEYVYPLHKPTIRMCYNTGGSIVNVDYDSVLEATSYEIQYKEEGGKWLTGAISKTNSAKIYGLESGKTYDIRVIAKRGLEKKTSESYSLEVSDTASMPWSSDVVGLDTPVIHYVTGNPLAGEVEIYCDSNSKINSTVSADGYQYCYTKVGINNDFVLKMKTKINNWEDSDKQRGYGIIVTDSFDKDTDGSNNKIIAGSIATKVQRMGDDGKLHNYDQKNGIGAMLKTGLTEENLEEVLATTDKDVREALGLKFSRYLLETRYNEQDNIIGNTTNGKGGDITEYYLELKKSGDIYSVTYTSLDGEFTNTVDYDLKDEFNQLDSEYIYVGMFAARSVSATFSEIDFAISTPADYAEVDAAIVRAEALDKDAYESFDDVETAIAAVDRNIGGSEQGRVDLMAKAINDAIKGLKLKTIVKEENGVSTTINSTSSIDGGKVIITDDGENATSQIVIESKNDDESLDSQIVADNESSLIDSFLTEAEKDAANSGEQVSFDLNVTDKKNEISKAEKKAIEKVLKGGLEIGNCIDITIEKTIGKKYLGVSELNSPITMSISVPEELNDGYEKEYSIVRVHDGIAEEISVTYDTKTKKLKFDTDKFSSYVIAYNNAHMHDYEVTYVWNDDLTKCTATHRCKEEGCTFEEIEDAVITSEITTNATCATDGVKTYTATYTVDWATTQTKTEDVKAKGHKYGEAAYTWNTDNSKCEAKRACTVDGCKYVEKAEATITSEITTSATCVAKGVKTYTATFAEDWAKTQTATEDVEATGHTYSDVVYTWNSDNSKCEAKRVCTVDGCKKEETASATVTSKITTPATCIEKGVKTYTATFTEGWAKTQTTTEDVLATGHTYGDAVYTWNADNSKCEAKRTCTVEGCKNEETASATVTSKITTPATCTEKGVKTYTAKFEAEWAKTQTVTEDVAATGHKYGEVIYTWNTDNSKCEAKRTCTIEGCKNEETASATVTSKITTLATCTEKGVKTYTATFEADWAKTQTATEDVEATGHKYGEVVYTWNADNSKCEAKHVCTVEGCKNAESVEAKITSDVIKAATTAAEGQIKFTAKFAEDWAKDQTTTGVIDKIPEEKTQEVTTEKVEEVSKEVTKVLDNAKTSEEKIEALATISTEDLKVAMSDTTGTAEKIVELENSYMEEKAITVGTTSTSTVVKSNEIKIDGAALNTSKSNVEVKLIVEEPTVEEKEKVKSLVDEDQYKNTVSFSMHLEGVDDSKNLKIPVKITIPVPAGMDPEKLVIIHFGNAGVDEIIRPVVKDGMATFVVSHFSTFAFAEGEKKQETKPVEEKDPVASVFKDVVAGKWYEAGVQYVYNHGIMSGYNDPVTKQPTGEFGTNGKLTREQFATMIYRMAGEPAVTFTGKFADVPAGKYYANAVEWCAANGIVTGYKDGSNKFGVGDNIKRQDIAVILHRYEGEFLKKDVSAKANYESMGIIDKAQVSSYADTATQWCVGVGILTGKDQKNGTYLLDPKGDATRAEVATMIMRYMTK